MHGEEVARQLSPVPGDQVVGEPVGRDTAACIGLGAALIIRRDAQATMLVMPADHVIEPIQEFRRAVQAAEQMAEEHSSALITIGIPPTYPAIGYGSIHRGPAVPHPSPRPTAGGGLGGGGRKGGGGKSGSGATLGSQAEKRRDRRRFGPSHRHGRRGEPADRSRRQRHTRSPSQRGGSRQAARRASEAERPRGLFMSS